MIRAGESDGKAPPRTDPPRKKIAFDKFRKWANFEWKRKIPVFIVSISVLQVVVFYGADDELRRVLPYRAEHKNEMWRFLTYMLLHANAVHLGLNVTIQGLLGTPLEFEQGWLRSAAIYFGGGLAGSLGASAFATFSSMVGASAGVYALLTSQIPNVVLNYGTIKFAAYRIVTVAALTASDVIYVFCHVYFFNNEGPRIGWVAHASGAAAGLLLGFLLFEGSFQWKRKFQNAPWLMLALPSMPGAAFSFAPSAPRSSSEGV